MTPRADVFEPGTILLFWATGVLAGLLLAALGRILLGRSARPLLGT